MLTAAQARALALALPETIEQDHHGRPSFRVAGKILATVPTERAMNVMAGQERIRAAAEDRPDACREVFWGKRLAAVRVDLDAADAELLEDLLDEAWLAKAPARLRRETQRGAHAQALQQFGLGGEDLAAWEASRLAPEAFEDWLTDRVARRPTGARSRAVYGSDDVHDFARRAILDALRLGPGDRLLEIGCGGGLLLREALDAGAAATGLDHSAEMVALARERAPDAEIVAAPAERLPFADGSFTALAMSIVFLFLPDPLAVLVECRRVLAPGARIAIYTTSPELRGTPAAPEPLASRCFFYDDEALAAIARRAGLSDVAVANADGGQLLTAQA